MYLELNNLTKSYGEKTVVDELSLSVEKARLLCILGSSGCGKTTTLNMIGGFVVPDKGRILLDGQDITDLPPETRPVTTVFQSYGLFPHMSVLSNIMYGLKFKKINKDRRREIAREYLDLVGLSEYENSSVGELSGGQQQRVALARALAVEPKLCLLDEPFSNLDAALREQMRGELKRIQHELGMTMVFVTHDQEEAIVLADTMAVIKDGRLVQAAPPDEIYRSPAEPYISEFLGIDRLRFEDGCIYRKIK